MNSLLRSNIWPGSTTTTKKLAQALVYKDIDTKDAYFNSMGFHNHFTHAVLAAYGLGAQPKTIQRIADAVESYQKPIRPAEEGTPITHTNWNNVKLLGNRSNYTTYLNYFRKAIEEKRDIPSLLQTYIYSREANDDGVAMLSRLFSGLIHPIIHLGYALEFDDVDSKREVLAQALAWTATHKPDYSGVITSDLWDEPEKPNAQRKTALQVYFDVLNNEKLSSSSSHTPSLDENNPMTTTNNVSGSIIAEEASKFDLPASQLQDKDYELSRELAFAALLMYTAGGYKACKQFKPEFVLVHVLNSSHFIPYVLKYTPDPIHKRLFLAAYFRAALLVYVARGRPHLPESSVVNDRQLPEDISNIWLQVVDDSLKQDDEHLTKATRTLAFYGRNFSQYIPPELESLGLDDSLWSRVAHQQMGAFKNGAAWSFDRPGFDQSWTNEKDVYDE